VTARRPNKHTEDYILTAQFCLFTRLCHPPTLPRLDVTVINTDDEIYTRAADFSMRQLCEK
jgi:hypothetical protein